MIFEGVIEELRDDGYVHDNVIDRCHRLDRKLVRQKTACQVRAKFGNWKESEIRNLHLRVAEKPKKQKPNRQSIVTAPPEQSLCNRKERKSQVSGS